MDQNSQKMVLSKNDKREREEETDYSPTIYKPNSISEASLIPMSYMDEVGADIDLDIVAPRFYNKFNFSKLAIKNESIALALGITSANRQEGKTLVASNMAVSLAQAYQQRTVLVDLNFHNPQLHKIFGTSREPGLAEALQHRILRINPTQVDDLYLLSAGDITEYQPGIKDTLALREILFTLKNEFDFIIVDLSSVFPIEEFPVHFLNEMDGLITVVDNKNTKKEHLREIYKHIDEHRFIGYIFNRTEGEAQ
jgi:Mrp family chromosome partitioning ATPase